MAGVVSHAKRKRQCLETVLEINPHNKQAKAELLHLQAREMVAEEQEKVSKAEIPEAAPSPTKSALSAPPPSAAILEGERRPNRWLYPVGGILLLCLCCAGPLWFLSIFSSTVAGDDVGLSERRMISATCTPRSGSGFSGGSGEYGEIIIGRPQLTQHAESSSLGMGFYHDLNDTDGTYHHTTCTPNCEQKLVMRSETHDTDDLDNLDYSFIYGDKDQFTVRSHALLAVLGLATPTGAKNSINGTMKAPRPTSVVDGKRFVPATTALTCS